MTKTTAMKRVACAAGLLLSASACTTVHTQRLAPGEAPTVLGPAVRDNRTPMEGALACFADHVAARHPRPLVIGVGEIKDYTGKYNINEGNAITQGGALMVYSALGKLGGSVQLAERFDPTIAERELGYIDRRQLGDGAVHDMAGPQGTQQVPWLPYYGGSIVRSDYYIVGGITELNFDIASGGAELAINQIGAKARTYHQSIAVDLRVVDTRTLMVVKTISLTKQLNGREVGAGVFRFFGSDLFDINVGAKGQEPLQLGIRTALEEGVVRLIGAVTHTDPEPCMTQRIGGTIPEQSAVQLRRAPAPAPTPAAVADAVSLPTTAAVNARPADAGAAAAASGLDITFEFGAAALTGAALDTMDRIAAMAAKGPIELLITARDTEVFDAGKRDSLTDQRIAAVLSALRNRGLPAGAIATVWRPASTDGAIHRDGPGRQKVARLRIGG